MIVDKEVVMKIKGGKAYFLKENADRQILAVSSSTFASLPE